MEKDINFIKRIDHAEIAASSKMPLDLDDVRRDFGDNFNTLMITNTDTASDIEVYINSEKAAFVTASNGTFSIDFESKINFNSVTLENTNAGAAISANSVKVSIGRTGV